MTKTEDDVEEAARLMDEYDEEPHSEGDKHVCEHDERHVAATLLLMKFLFFLSGVSASTWGRFGTVYYNEHGLSAAEIGVITGAMPCIQAVAQPAWGYLADKMRDRKRVTLVTSIVSTLLLLLLAIPAVGNSGFWGIFSVSAAMSCFVSASILDAYTLDLLGEEKRDKYGEYRVWCAVAWGLGAMGMGYVTDTLGFDANFALYAVLSFLSIALIAWKVPNQTALEKSIKSSAMDVMTLVSSMLQARVVIFFIEIVAFGMGMALVERLLFLYLINDLNASTTLCGLTVGVTVLFELPIFHYSAALLRVMSHDAMFMVAMVCYIGRVYGYTLLTPDTVWYILALECLHGVTFAMMWTASVSFTATFSPKEWLTTAQSVMTTAYFCVGNGLGALIGGWVMQHYGARFMYRGAAFLVLILFCVHGLGLAAMKIRKKTR